jgi:hypothetical protein
VFSRSRSRQERACGPTLLARKAAARGHSPHLRRGLGATGPADGTVCRAAAPDLAPRGAQKARMRVEEHTTVRECLQTSGGRQHPGDAHARTRDSDAFGARRLRPSTRSVVRSLCAPDVCLSTVLNTAWADPHTTREEKRRAVSSRAAFLWRMRAPPRCVFRMRVSRCVSRGACPEMRISRDAVFGHSGPGYVSRDAGSPSRHRHYVGRCTPVQNAESAANNPVLTTSERAL